MDDIQFEVTKHIGIISDGKGSWKKELNLVSWSGRDPKLDLREWAPDHKKMGKGVTLTREEAAKLSELLAAINKTA